MCDENVNGHASCNYWKLKYIRVYVKYLEGKVSWYLIIRQKIYSIRTGPISKRNTIKSTKY